MQLTYNGVTLRRWNSSWLVDTDHISWNRKHLLFSLVDFTAAVRLEMGVNK